MTRSSLMPMLLLLQGCAGAVPQPPAIPLAIEGNGIAVPRSANHVRIEGNIVILEDTQ